jgi:titin
MPRFPGGRAKALNIVPNISAQPAANTNVGLNSAFAPSITVNNGTLPIVIEWYKTGFSTVLATSTANTLPFTSNPTLLANAGTADIATYYAKVTNRANTLGSNSSNTTLGILPSAPNTISLAGNGTARTLVITFGTGAGNTYLNGGTLSEFIYTIFSDAAYTTPVAGLSNVATPAQAKTVTVTNSNLNNGTTYYARVFVRTLSSGDSSPASSAGAFPYAPPQAPSGMTVAGNGTSNTLVVTFPTQTSTTLNHSTFGSFEYSVYSNSGLTNIVGSYSAVTTTNTTVTLTNALFVNGTTYYVRARVYSSNASYGDYASASGTPTTVPSAPTSVTLTRSASQSLSLSFGAATAQGAAITGYQYSVFTDPGLTAAVAGKVNVAAAVGTNSITGLTNGTTYYVNVWATSALGAGTGSAVSAYPFEFPTAPTSVSLGSAGNGVLTLTFGAATAQGEAITGYNYTLYTDAALTAAVAGKTDVAGASPSGTVISGLANGTTYYARVYATTARGNGTAGSFTAGATPFTTPTAPASVTLGSAVNGGLTLSFAASTARGSAITGYRYTLYTNSGLSTVVPGRQDVAVSVGNTAITGLSNGTTYYAAVYATSGAGNSETGTFTSGLMVGAAANAPTGVTLTVASSTSLNVSFTGSVTNGSTINSYVLTLRTVAASTGPAVPAYSGVTITSGAVLTGLVTGTTYFADVVANYTFGGSTANTAAGSSSGVTCAVAPAAPSSVTLAAASSTSVTLSFVTGVTNGATINNYTYSLRAGASYAVSSYVAGQQNISTTATSGIPITGLSTGTTYYAEVKTNYTVNGVAGSTGVTVSSGVTTVGVPSAPSSITLAATSGTTMSLTFTPGSLNGSTLTNYSYSLKRSSDNVVVSGPTTTSSTSGIGISGLTAGTTYYAEVWTNSNLGEGARGTSTAVLCAAAPSAPSGVTLTVASATSMTLSFTPGATNGSTLQTNPYNYTINVGSVSGTQQASGSTSSTSGISITGLTTGTAYFASVYTASTNFGNSASASSSGVVCAIAPAAPTSVLLSRIAGSSTSLSLSFVAGSTNGSTLTASPYRYILYSGAIGGTVAVSDSGTTSSPITIGGLTAGTTYTARMYTASSNAGNSAFADFTAGTLCAAAPSATAANYTLTNGTSNQITFNWGSVFTANGSAITGYTYTVYNSGGVVVAGPTSAGTNTSITQTGLNNGTQYYIIVSATNAAGSTSAQSNNVACIGAPAFTGSFSNTNGTSGQVTFNWGSVFSNNGSSITGYNYTVRTSGGTVVAGPTSTTNSSVTITGLSNGTDYNITVTATNGAGTSAGAQSGNIVCRGVPSGTISYLFTRGNQQLTFSWSGWNTNGAAILDYTYTFYTSPGNAVVAGPTTTTNTSATATGLTNGTNYYISVSARNAAGSSTAIASDWVTVCTVPGVSGNMTYTKAAGTITLNWDAPAVTGGCLIQGYKVRLRNGATVVSDWTTVTNRTTTYTGVPDGQNYTADLIAYSAAGDGATNTYTGILSFVTIVAPAGTPVPVSMTYYIGNNWRTTRVNFSGATGFGTASVVTGMTVTGCPSNNGSWLGQSWSCFGGSSGFTVNNANSSSVLISWGGNVNCGSGFTNASLCVKAKFTNSAGEGAETAPFRVESYGQSTTILYSTLGGSGCLNGC